MQNQLRLLRNVSALILIAATWRLWFYASDFPAVPFFGFLTDVPRAVDRMLSGIMVVVLLVDTALVATRLLWSVNARPVSRIEQVCDLLFTLCVVSLTLLNQHLLQPWLYHFLVLTPLLWRHLPATADGGKTDSHEASEVSSTEETSPQVILYLTASIYVWSAWSKLDAGFLQSHGPKFIEAIADAIGLSTQFWSARVWRFAAAMLPVGELMVGVALLFHVTRKCALATSMFMHLLLIVAVGPWGLNHEAGVLLWNGYFIAQNVILLMAVRRANVTVRLVRVWQVRPATFLVTVGVIVCPAFRSIGCCDTWPAWAVYASSPARVLVQVRDESIDQLADPLHQYVESRPINDGWSWLKIDLWSLDATGTPIYPEDRFQLGVARAILQDAALGNNVRVIHEEEADSWTGERTRNQAVGNSEITEIGAQFSLNSTPRSW